jgi:hypothetical protein
VHAPNEHLNIFFTKFYLNPKITNIPLILKIWEIIFCFWANYSMGMGQFSGYFEGASTFLTAQNIPEMANKIIFPQKK